MSHPPFSPFAVTVNEDAFSQTPSKPKTPVDPGSEPLDTEGLTTINPQDFPLINADPVTRPVLYRGIDVKTLEPQSLRNAIEELYELNRRLAEKSNANAIEVARLMGENAKLTAQLQALTGKG